MDDQPAVATTLFPKITGKHADFIENLNKVRAESPEIFKDMKELPMTGYVKLHGAHNDIVIESDNTIRLQSRNIASLNLEKDSYGFAKQILPFKSNILALKDQIYARFKEKNPGVEIEQECPLIIGGEWIGPGVQRDVAISNLPTRLLVIISISINGIWLPDEDYADICDPDARIYHVSRGGSFYHLLPLGTDEEIIASLETLQPLADAVENECPFGKTFGLVGRGEGIVYKPVLTQLQSSADFWLKVKGPISRLGGRGLKAPQMPDQWKGLDPKEAANKFAAAAVTEPRLEQAWDFLRETGVERNKQGMSKFLEWLRRDIQTEEKREIEKLNSAQQSLIKQEITSIGRGWFIRKLQAAKVE